MTPRAAARRRPLRRIILVATVAVAATATALMLAFGLVSDAIRKELEASHEELRVEQVIADNIVRSAYGQQLAAFRYLQRADPRMLEMFRTEGARVYGEVRKYLFREMPVQSRLKVELIKETHQAFEVAAQHAFDVSGGGPALVAERIAELGRHTTRLEDAVRDFIADRELQGEQQRLRLETRLEVFQWALLTAALLLGIAAIALANLLRQRVMRPLAELSAAVGRFGTTDDAVNVGPQQYSEFQLLADSFGRMAERIRDSRREIVARNIELTGTLDELRRTQQELVQREKLSAVGEMLAGLAHELNNPLAGVLGLAEVLRDDVARSGDPQTRALAQSVVAPLVEEALRARALVRNLLHFARPANQQLEPVRLAEPIAVAVGLCRHRIAHSYRIEVDVPDDLCVVAQTQKLEHATVNLLNNAVDALREGDGSAIRVRARAEGDEVVVAVEDDGTGFKELERAFDPFYTTKPVGAGTGLGLALVHRFAREFGGSVRAENLASRGARVTLRLRRATGLPTPAAEQPHAVAAAAVPGGAAARKRVLVVDDEPALREVQKRLLARMGLDASAVGSGTEAQDLLTRSEFDLIITDLRMPGAVSGHDLLAWLTREHPPLARTALVVTGDVGGMSRPPLAPVPLDRVLTKPFDRAEYEARVRQALGQTTPTALAS